MVPFRLTVKDGFQLPISFEMYFAVEGLTCLGLTPLERDGLPGEKGRCLPLGELLPAEGKEFEATACNLLPRPVFLLFISIGGAAIDAPDFHYILPALGTFANGRSVSADVRANIGCILMSTKDLDDVLLQGVHVRLAVCDVLLDEPPAGRHVRPRYFRRE